MCNVVSVRFRGTGKIYYFDPGDLEIESGMHVVVETARGQEYGMAITGIKEVADEKVPQPLKPVVRIATPEDDAHVMENREKEREALALCKEKIRKHELEMKLIDVEYTFDDSKILFYFTADGRVDFRELVKDLAGVFRTRIELRQIGVRDETKILGGIGICGRPLCCHSYLTDFIPVSIRMAKEQNLSLNPTKISGVCGRLMCCLKNEEDTYEYLNSQMPVYGDTVTSVTGITGTVCEINVLRQTVKVLVEDENGKEIHDFPVSEVQFRPRRRRHEAANDDQTAQTHEPRSRREGRSKGDNAETGEHENRPRREGRSKGDNAEAGEHENRPRREGRSRGDNAEAGEHEPRSRREGRSRGDNAEAGEHENRSRRGGRPRGEGAADEHGPRQNQRREGRGTDGHDGQNNGRRDGRPRAEKHEKDRRGDEHGEGTGNQSKKEDALSRKRTDE